MEPGVVYHSADFELAGLLCACGCGRRVTLLVPDGHRVFEEGGNATIVPSVGILDGCHSHFIVTAGEVDWLPPFTARQAQHVIQTQIARHAARDTRPTWAARVLSWLLGLWKTLF